MKPKIKHVGAGLMYLNRPGDSATLVHVTRIIKMHVWGGGVSVILKKEPDGYDEIWLPNVCESFAMAAWVDALNAIRNPPVQT